MESEKGSWGGQRAGSGSKPKWNHGDTVVVRIPQALLNDVIWYAKLIDGQFPNGMQTDNCLACEVNYEAVNRSREIEERLNLVTQERDRFDRELNELHAINGDLVLEIEELKNQLDNVTQSSHSDGTGNNGEMAAAIAELQSKIESKAKGYTSNSFTQGIKVICSLRVDG